MSILRLGSAATISARMSWCPRGPNERHRPTIRVGDTVLSKWGFGKGDFYEGYWYEGLVSAVNDDDTLGISFTGRFDGWVEPKVPRGRYIWVMLESDRARFEGFDNWVDRARWE